VVDTLRMLFYIR